MANSTKSLLAPSPGTCPIYEVQERIGALGRYNPNSNGEPLMATAQQLKALIESYTHGDRSRFLSVASQIAAHAAKAGKERLADDLRELVNEAKRASDQAPVTRLSVPIAQPTGELSGLVSATYPKQSLSEMVLSNELEQRLLRVLREFKQSDALAGHGLSPRRKLLLLGPPGCGKSMTAAALAGELHLPLLTVQFHTLITKFMGETAAKLRLIFDAMKRQRGVYLFDEFDAIGTQRLSGHDVGEIRRVLNSFLVFLEQDDSTSLIIAASNLASSLDVALYRRFDDVIHYAMPSKEMIRRLVENRLSPFVISRLSWTQVQQSAEGLSHADICKACEDAAKDAILDDRTAIRTQDLIRALRYRQHD